MRKRSYLLLTIAVVVMIISCSKDVSKESSGDTGGGGTPTDTTSTPANTEVGNWKFISLHTTLVQTTEYTESNVAVKGVTSTDYTTENNAGTIQFDGSKMTTNGVAFTINTTSKTYVYLNGMLADSLTTPLNNSVPPQSTSADYKKIGSDSLYFASGGLVDIGTGGALPPMPTGYKLKFEGDKMTMTFVYDNVSNQTNQGVPEKVTTHAVIVATLQKA